MREQTERGPVIREEEAFPNGPSAGVDVERVLAWHRDRMAEGGLVLVQQDLLSSSADGAR
jgi:hypothetical protein